MMTTNKTNMLRRRYFSLLSLIVTLTFMLSSVMVFADPADLQTYSNDVRSEMQAQFSSKNYTVSGGGTFKYSDLLIQDTDPARANIYIINEANWSRLTSSAQSEFLEDLDTCAKAVVNNAGNAYTDETQTNWYKVLQTQQGVGSKFMNVILANTKPDFVTANRIYQPFSGLVGTVMGLAAVLIMAFLGIVMVSDIAYITLPPVRMFVADDDKGSGTVKSKLFSHDAIYAVQVAESNSDNGGGSPKQALGIYFKRRVAMLILLGICLLYLVQGSIYKLVGYILDLVSGFTGD